jgi:cell division protein FtsX
MTFPLVGCFSYRPICYHGLFVGIISAVLIIVLISISSTVLSIVPAVLSIRPTVPRLISSVLNIWLGTKVYLFLFIPPLNNLERPKSSRYQREVVVVKTEKA